MSTPSGSIGLSSSLIVAVPAGSTVLSPYNVPVQPTGTAYTSAYTAGTGANQINKVAQTGGSAAAAAASTDLTALVCVDGSTGFSHVRELIAVNLDGTNILLWDFTATNALVAMFGAGGATAKVNLQPLSWVRFAKPVGTNGYTVDSTHKIVSLDPGANTISWALIAAGD